MSEAEYLLKYEIDPENYPKCVGCGKIPQLGGGWNWKANCKNKSCVRAAINLGFTDEVKKRISNSVKKTFKENPDIVEKMTRRSIDGNNRIGNDGLTGYERAKLKREHTLLETHGHKSFANWEKTKETWANKTIEEKEQYAKESSDRQKNFPIEKKKEISDRIVANHLKKYGVACPANLHPQFGSSRIASQLFEALDCEFAKFKPKTKEQCVDRLLVDFCIGNKVIEFYGDYWHANPLKFKPSDVVGKGRWTAQHIWQKDADRIEKIKNAGYDVLVIWEREFKKHPNETIRKCKEWLSNT